jgi:hypothetical protein
MVATQEEAIADFVAWAKKYRKVKINLGRQTRLEGIEWEPSLDIRPEDMPKQKADEEAKKQWNNGIELGGTEKSGTDGQFAGQEQGGK